MKTQYMLFCLFGVMVLTNVVYADEVNFGKQIPTTNDVIEAFGSSDTNPSAIPEDTVNKSSGQMRTIKMDAFYNKKKIVTPRLKPTDSIKKISLQVNFGYNSAELTDSAIQQLRPVGEALASGKLSNRSYIIEGHTDAIGSDIYNNTLSKQRAASVKSFLVNTFNLTSMQIKAVGKGKRELLDSRNPESEVNRRVSIIAIK